MNKRQKKKLENRAGFFHYRDYKSRVKILYDIFGSLINESCPYAYKAYMFECTKTVLFTKAPIKDFRLENCVGRFNGKKTASSACEAMGMEVD